MMIRALVIMGLVLVGAYCAAQPPMPFCNSKKIFREGPLAINQRVVFDMSDAFSGYNLDIKVATNTSTVKITPKFAQLQQKRIYIPSLITHHIQSVGNQWGKQSFILYKDITGSIYFGHGLFNKSDSLPIIEYTILVSSQKYVNCFGAALFYDHGLAIVDCTHAGAQGQISNHFYYLDLTSHKVSKVVENPIFVPFQQITKRKLIRFTDHQTGYTYLLRAYLHEGVGSLFKHNTYIELFSALDPQDLQLLRVLDRSYFHLDSKNLQIMDIEVYMGDIFFLDYYHGLFRLDVLKNQDIRVTGRYRKDNCYRFAVYSDDLENEVIVALANSHAIYEINMADFSDPYLINKYSLMEYSYIRELYMNDEYLIVQSTANATNQTHENYEIDYTWIFTKGSRTYMNAYHVVNHNSSKVEVDLNNYNNQVIIADEEAITLYQLSPQRTQFDTNDTSLVGTQQDVIFIANSTDPDSEKSFACQQKMHLFYTYPNDTNIYETGYDYPTNYSLNYPGELQIFLRTFFTGANLTYQVKNQDSNYIPTYWVDKINETKVQMDGNIGNSIFFHTQVIPELGDERIIFFDQDGQYKTHVVECRHIWESIEVICIQQAEYNHTAKITAFTTAFFLDKEIGFSYYAMMVFGDNLKQIRGYDYTRHQNFFNITYYGQKQAQITSISSSNGYLYVLRKEIKTIDVYKLSTCAEEQTCPIEFSINADLLKAQGIKYFAPKKIITDFSHPQVLFIQCIGSVVIVDVDNKERVTVLTEVTSDGAQNLFSQIAVNHDRMMIVSEPDNIEIYSLHHIYKKKLVFLKNLPLYGYEVPLGSDIQFSDVDPLVYVNARDPASNKSIVLIYNTLESTDSSLYGTITLPEYYTRPALEIEVSGFIVDFLTIKTPKGFRIFRVFDFPVLSIKDSQKDINFTVNCFNSGGKNKTAKQLTLNRLQTDLAFTPTDELNKTMNNLKLQNEGNYTWDDRDWFKGHKTGYNFSCDECGNQGSTEPPKVRVREHVQTMRSLPINANDYIETYFGGLSVSQDLFQFHYNGSINKIINLPDQKRYEYCQKIATTYDALLVFTACVDQTRGTNIYVTTQTSFKEWTWGPFQSSADGVNNFQVAGDILAITDTSPYPQYHFTKGAVYLYSKGFDLSSAEELDELQIINEDDLVGVAHGYDKDSAYIANSHLSYNPFDKIYRLFLTEVDNGLFVVDFTYELGRRQINLLVVQYVDLKSVIQKSQLHMPSDASFFAVTTIAGKYHPKLDTLNAIVTINKYHNIEVELGFDETSHIASQNLVRIYHRYGYYDIANEVRADFQYIAIPYKLPPIYQVSTNNFRQILGVYDTQFTAEEASDNKLVERFMLGGFRFNKTSDIIFGFNRTHDIHSNGTRTGLVVTSHFTDSRQMFEVSLSKNLTAHLNKDFKNQQLKITAFSDYNSYSFEITLYNFEAEEEFILAIVIAVLVGITTIGFICYIVIVAKKRKRQQQQISEQRVSLLTDSETIRQSLPSSGDGKTGEYKPPGDSGYESDSDEQEKEKEKSGEEEGEEEEGESENSSEEDNQDEEEEDQDDTLQANGSGERDQLELKEVQELNQEQPEEEPLEKKQENDKKQSKQEQNVQQIKEEKPIESVVSEQPAKQEEQEVPPKEQKQE